ncbi:Uncharacterised protein [Burkholderia pseudomallei]|nr:Uncharacterised protein [Burkholderia pseudomallei]CAJ6702201.1 Uncharacterised protein [Burkholderia pseudomallei]
MWVVDDLSFIHDRSGELYRDAEHYRIKVEESQLADITVVQPTANELDRLSDELQARLAFGIGALSRGALEDLAADFGLDFDKWVSSDDLRADVLEEFSSQGYPHRKFEYDDAYWGGEYAGSSHVVYVPQSLIAALGDEDIAFCKFSHRDPIHIVNVDSETSYRASGEPFIGPDVFNEAVQNAVQIGSDVSFFDIGPDESATSAAPSPGM